MTVILALRSEDAFTVPIAAASTNQVTALLGRTRAAGSALLGSVAPNTAAKDSALLAPPHTNAT